MKYGLRSLFVAESTITDIVGQRVYVGTVPQDGSLPHVLITQTDSEENKTLDGTGGLRFIDVDVDCKAARNVTASSLADAVRAYIQDYTGSAGDVTIKAVLLNDESEGHEPPVDGTDLGIHYVTLDLTVQFTE